MYDRHNHISKRLLMYWTRTTLYQSDKPGWRKQYYIYYNFTITVHKWIIIIRYNVFTPQRRNEGSIINVIYDIFCFPFNCVALPNANRLC